MHGRRFSRATSCARRCFFTVMGKYVPPFTVASLATTITSQPLTRPMPVMSPAAGAASSYIPCAASGDSSRNGEPGSSRARMRSRGSSLPRATCFSRALAPPPSAVRARAAFSSSVSLRRWAALPRKASLLLSMVVERTVMVGSVASEGANRTFYRLSCERRKPRCPADGRLRAKGRKKTGRTRRPVRIRLDAEKGSVTLHRVLGLGGGDLGVVGSLARLVRGVFHGIHRAGLRGGRSRRRAGRHRSGRSRGFHRARSCTRRGSSGTGGLGSSAGRLRSSAGGCGGGAGRILLRFIGRRLIAGIAAGRQRQGHCSGDGSHEYGTRELHWRSPGLGRGKPRKWPAY